MKGRAILFASCVLALAGCDLFDDGAFSEPREYRHHLFESAAECEAAQPPDFFFNCYQEVVFCPDRSATIMLTDIINAGTYRVRSRRVTLDLRQPAEVSGPLRFTVSPDGQSLTADWSGAVWTRADTDARGC